MAMVYFFLLILEALESFCAKALKIRSQIKRNMWAYFTTDIDIYYRILKIQISQGDGKCIKLKWSSAELKKHSNASSPLIFTLLATPDLNCIFYIFYWR